MDLQNNNIDFNLRKFHSFVLVHLKKLTKLQCLSFSVGNPSANKISKFRLYLILELPSLRVLDGKYVEKAVMDCLAIISYNAKYSLYYNRREMKLNG